MNKHLNNWLDKMDGLPEETSNNNIRKEMARQLGQRGGKQSAKSRFSGKSKSEISEMMRRVRVTKQDREALSTLAENLADNLGKNVTNE